MFIHQAQQRDAFIQGRYGQYDLSDPFLALQRDSEAEERQSVLSCPAVHPQGRAVGPNPLAVLKLVMAHCKRMQERMMGQLAAAESRHTRVSVRARSNHKTQSQGQTEESEGESPHPGIMWSLIKAILKL